MKWTSDIRLLALLRRIARAAEGIEEQLRYQNERSFPPVHSDNEGRKKTIFSRKKPEDAT